MRVSRRLRRNFVGKTSIVFTTKLKDGSITNVLALKTFKYFGEQFAFHERIVPADKPKATTFSVSHIATGICIDAGFGYKSFEEARIATHVYLKTVGKRGFKKAIESAKEKLRG
jgi:hypothetical protein